MAYPCVNDYPRFEFTQVESAYPANLRTLKRPPERLYLVGHPEVLEMPMLSVVGAREATPYGLQCAQLFARRASRQGFCIVSGGARGCDQAAHQGALDCGGPTIVVLAGGADVTYPASARALFEQVLAGGGALVSERPWGCQPAKWAFRERNRIIAALGAATLIVEAGLPSGTFSTADETLTLGHDVWAVPGSIFSAESKGANRLIAQGALAIVDTRSFDEAIQGLGLQYGFQRALPFEGNGGQELKTGGEGADGAVAPLVESELAAGIMHALKAQAMGCEELSGALGASVMEVLRELSCLEVAGRLRRGRDGRYSVVVLEKANILK